MKEKILEFFFAAIYFLIFCFLIDLVFRNTLSMIADILAVGCWIAALVISLCLANYTVKKIRDK